MFMSSYIIEKGNYSSAFFFLIFIHFMDEVVVIFKAKLSDNLTLFFPGGAKFWLQNSLSERGRCPLSTATGALPLDPAGA